MDDIKAMILISGNGTNMQNLILSCHKKSIFEIMKNYNVMDGDINKYSMFNQNLTLCKDSINLDSIFQKKINFIEVLSNRANALGLQKAKNLNINTKIIESKGKSRDEFDKELSFHLNFLRDEFGLEFILLAGFMRILSDSFFLNISKDLEILNIHPSFLPLHKGANGIADSFNDERDFGGVSVHYVNRELDSGRIILQEKLPKIKNESLESFETRIHTLEHSIYPLAFVRAILEKSGLDRKTIF